VILPYGHLVVDRPRGGRKGVIPGLRKLALGGASWYLCVGGLSVSTALRSQDLARGCPLVSEGVAKIVRGFCLDSIFKREDGRRAGTARRTAGSALHIPYPEGDYDKIGRPSLQDGVGRLARFSPRDDHGKVVSVSIQRPRPDRRAAGVTRLGRDCCFL